MYPKGEDGEVDPAGVFKTIDYNGNGMLNNDELINAMMRDMRDLETMDRILRMAQNYMNDEGEMDFDHFLKLMAEVDRDNSGHLSKAEFLDAINESLALNSMIQKLNLPLGFTVRELFTLIDSSSDGMISPEEFKAEMGRLIGCDAFQCSCVILMKRNHITGLIKDVYTAVQSVPLTSQNPEYYEGAAPPHCLKGEFNALRMELQEMKVGFHAKLDSLLLACHASCAEAQLGWTPSTFGEAPHNCKTSSTAEKNPIWIPLPALGGNREMMSLGERSVETENMEKQGGDYRKNLSSRFPHHDVSNPTGESINCDSELLDLHQRNIYMC